jgi:DnaJ family protein A protein 2
MKVTVTSLGPGRYAQQRGPCPDCRGSGETIPAKDRCKTCNGEKVVEDSKILKVEIDKGSKEGKKVVFRGESDELPGAQPGDLIFVVKEKPHALFKREGVHLYIEKEILLIEALAGTKFTINHLDGRKLLVKSEPGQCIRPGDCKEILNEVMMSQASTLTHARTT